MNLDEEDLAAAERQLGRGGIMFAVVELLLALASFIGAYFLWTGAVDTGLLSKHATYFAAGGVLLGVIFLVGGLRGLWGRGRSDPFQE